MSRAIADTSVFIAEESGRDLGDLPVDPEVASCFARIASSELSEGRRLRRHDTWIAATAMRHNAAVVTQDTAFSTFRDVAVIRI